MEYIILHAAAQTPSGRRHQWVPGPRVTLAEALARLRKIVGGAVEPDPLGVWHDSYGGRWTLAPGAYRVTELPPL